MNLLLQTYCLILNFKFFTQLYPHNSITRKYYHEFIFARSSCVKFTLTRRKTITVFASKEFERDWSNTQAT